MAPRRYRFLEHMTDAYIEAFGSSLEEAYANAALALTATVVEVSRIIPRSSKTFMVDGRDRLGLLYNWLEAVLVEMNVGLNIFKDFSVKISEDGGFKLVATARGEGLVPSKHKPRVEVKAVTYHLMEIYQEKGRYVAKFLLDL